MKRIIDSLIVVFLVYINIYAQEEKIIVTGNSLVGKKEQGKNIRIIAGNVAIKHNNSIIICDTAYQFVEDNSVALYGNVKFKRNNLIITTQQAFYDGNKKKLETKNQIEANDGNFYIRSDNGEYDAEDEIARLSGRIFFRDSNKTIICDKAIYKRKEEKIVCEGNARLNYDEFIAFADRVEYFKKRNFVKAESNARMENTREKTILASNLSEIFLDEKKAFAYCSPVIYKIDTASINQIDTLIISADKFQYVYKDKEKKIFAGRNVLFYSSQLISRSDTLIFDLIDSTISTHKISSKPTAWFNSSQIKADSIFIKILNRQPLFASLHRNVLFVEEIDSILFKYNQLSSDSAKVFFSNSKISLINSYQKVLSVYYLFDDGEANGVLKSSSDYAVAVFEDSKIVNVKLYNNPVSEYYSESLVENKTIDFLLPGFELDKNKFTKQAIIRLNTTLKKEMRE